MIVVDGQKVNLEVKNFANLEDLLVKVMGRDEFQERIVTDVYVNDEIFSELYPHQAEDVEVDEIEKIEIKTMPITQMASEMVKELDKVLELLAKGGKEVAELFRQGSDFEALDMYQDFLQVLQDLMGILNVFRQEGLVSEIPSLQASIETLSNLFSELMDAQEQEDWILLADLLEYDLLPHLEEWKNVIKELALAVKN